MLDDLIYAMLGMEGVHIRPVKTPAARAGRAAAAAGAGSEWEPARSEVGALRFALDPKLDPALAEVHFTY